MSATCSAAPMPRWAIRQALPRPAASPAMACFFRRRADGLRALLRLAPDAGHRSSTRPSRAPRTSRRFCPIARPAPAPPTSSSNTSAQSAGASRLCHGSVDAVRHRRHRLGEHALTRAPTSRPATRTPIPATSGSVTWPGAGVDYRLDTALVGTRRISLHQPRIDGLRLRRCAGAL